MYACEEGRVVRLSVTMCLTKQTNVKKCSEGRMEAKIPKN